MNQTTYTSTSYLPAQAGARDAGTDLLAGGLAVVLLVALVAVWALRRSKHW